ncbi:UvrB/UvrC motif-containing protein [Bacillus sp. LL01]|uniref:UvrB/UvrC motif-containing protein n=1 Tax=Bacillus sp. LL01 TaxID=1665556 RepID=UPI001F526135|nr:UvrB/UvrC motif-containing protein [Bacillus sp. LL01]
MYTQPLRGDVGWSFGPYTSKKAVSRAIYGLKDVYRLQCSNPAINGSPCLNYSLGLCRGICLGGKALAEYNQIAEQLVSLLKGEDSRLLEDMQRQMAQHAEDLAFERAAQYRNYIQSLQGLLRKEEVMDFTAGNHVMMVAERLNEERVKLFLIRRTDVLFSGIYKVDVSDNGVNAGKSLSEIKAKVLLELDDTAPAEPRQISRFEIDKAQIIYSYLRSGKCRYAMVSEDEVYALEKVIEKLVLA